MRKVVFGINMTADGYCSHEDGIADEELHNYFTAMLQKAEVLLCGRITYELMVPYWPDMARKPSEDESSNAFARVYDALEKVVFSDTMKQADDPNTRISTVTPAEEVLRLREQPGKDIIIGSLSLASQLAQMDLIDEYHIAVHPVIAGKGPRLFEDYELQERLMLECVGTRQFRSGVMALEYRR